MTDDQPQRHGGYIPGKIPPKKHPYAKRISMAERELRCPGCGVLCADPRSLEIHMHFCPIVVERRKKQKRKMGGGTE